MTESVADKLIFAGVKLVILILVMLLGVGGEWLLHKGRERGQSTHSNKIGLHGGVEWDDLVERWLGRYG